MTGETNLNKLLASLSPKLDPTEYVFCSVKGELAEFIHCSPLATFTEDEGLTLVITRQTAEQNGLNFESHFKRISLMVHSSLNAVGLTAAVSAQLTKQGISANIIAGYYHDHIFVQAAKADPALEALRNMLTKDV
ncbi:MAG: ACT domain-containing protein [Enterobacterales bacterium]|nr:ACT domain-containing protein [Enterobacterales bacterium]